MSVRFKNEHQDGVHEGAPNPDCPMCKPEEPKEKTMPRKRAADLIDRVRTLIVVGTAPDKIEEVLAREFGVEPLTRCRGEAHSNPYIDHCGVCAPRWGWTGPRIKIT